MGHDGHHSYVSIEYKGKEYSGLCHSYADTITVQSDLGHQSARSKSSDVELLKKLLLREIVIEAEKRGALR